MTLVGGVHLVAGGAEAVLKLVALLEKEGITVRGNPDVYLREYSHFGIEEARELRSRARLRSFSGGQRVFVVAAPGMNAEAQNALLKTLEERPADAMFFFIVPAPELLLPTVRSRAQMLALSAPAEQGAVDAEEFLAAAPPKRILMLKPLLERGEDDARDLGAIVAFLAALERALAARAGAARGGLRAIYRARRYAADKGALLKPLLEQIALLVPRGVR